MNNTNEKMSGKKRETLESDNLFTSRVHSSLFFTISIKYITMLLMQSFAIHLLLSRERERERRMIRSVVRIWTQSWNRCVVEESVAC